VIRKLGQACDNETIVNAVVGLCGKPGIATVGEGMEGREDLSFAHIFRGDSRMVGYEPNPGS